MIVSTPRQARGFTVGPGRFGKVLPGPPYVRPVKVQWSGIGIVEGSGKVGDEVAARNRHGAYMRAKGAPNFPGTSYQVNWNGYLTTATQLYPTLTADEVTSWQQVSRHIPRVRFLRSDAPCTGQRLFMRVNMWLQFFGAATVNTPPVPVIPVSGPAFTFTPSTVGPSLTFANDNPSGSSRFVVWATPPITSSIRYVRNRLRLLGSYNVPATTSIDLYSEYVARFPVPSAGEETVFLVLPVDQASVTFGSPLQFRAAWA